MDAECKLDDGEVWIGLGGEVCSSEKSAVGELNEVVIVDVGTKAVKCVAGTSTETVSVAVMVDTIVVV